MYILVIAALYFRMVLVVCLCHEKIYPETFWQSEQIYEYWIQSNHAKPN